MSTSTIHLIDVDGTICEGGSDELHDGVVEQLQAWREKGEPARLFTCRALHGAGSDGKGSWLENLAKQGAQFQGHIHKPLADHYTWWDDKILAAGHCLCHQEYPTPEHGLWFSRNEIADILGEDAVQKLVSSRK